MPEPVVSDRITRQVALWATTASMLWGTSYVAAKYAVGYIPPFSAAAFRFGIVAAICLPLLWVTRKGQKIERGDWAGLSMVGLFQTSFYFALQYAGIKLTTASNTSVIVNVRPVFAAILSAVVLHESISSRKAAGILLAFLGVFTLSTKGSLAAFSLQSDHVFGDFLILLNAISGAIGLVVNKRVLAKFRPFPAMVYTQTIGAIGLLPFAAVEIASRGSFPRAPALPWLMLVFQGVFSTILAHIFWNRALARLEASRAAVFIYIAPLTTGILSWLLLRESLGVPFAIGALLVLVGAYLTTSATNGNQTTRSNVDNANPG
jgi:drug/metabolite transporter (DMT)-like permease